MVKIYNVHKNFSTAWLQVPLFSSSIRFHSRRACHLTCPASWSRSSPFNQEYQSLSIQGTAACHQTGLCSLPPVKASTRRAFPWWVVSAASNGARTLRTGSACQLLPAAHPAHTSHWQLILHISLTCAFSLVSSLLKIHISARLDS